MPKSKPTTSSSSPMPNAAGAGATAMTFTSPFAGLTGVTRQSLNQQVYESLHQALASGYFAPGQRVPLRAVASALGTSTMPVREAVNRLVAIGALALGGLARPVHVPIEKGEKLPSGGNDVTHGTAILGVLPDGSVPILWTEGTSAAGMAEDFHTILTSGIPTEDHAS